MRYWINELKFFFEMLWVAIRYLFGIKFIADIRFDGEVLESGFDSFGNWAIVLPSPFMGSILYHEGAFRGVRGGMLIRYTKATIDVAPKTYITTVGSLIFYDPIIGHLRHKEPYLMLEAETVTKL